MIRLTALALYVIGFSLYAAKDWFKSLCALILLMAVIEHPDMPKTIMGIQGLNPWNILLVAVVFGWARARRQEGLSWDLPPFLNVLLLLYLGVILIGFARMVADPGALDQSAVSMASEYLVNTVKWVIPGLLLFDGARTRSRFLLGLASLLGVYFLLGVQVIKWMPISYAVGGESLSARSLKILTNEIGYHRVNISAMLAGASWAIFATRPLVVVPWHRAAILAAAVSVAFAQALTAGRAGYVTWAIVGFILCAMRWRKYLLGVPVLVAAVLILAPGVAQRMLEGFTAETRDVNVRLDTARGGDAGGPDAYTISAGRTVIWPYVIDRIKDAPLFGHGRQAMVRIGLTRFLELNLGEAFGHPHNAYLELLLDNGIVGLLLILPFYAVVLRYSISLFMDSRHPIFTAIGGVASALILALLIAGTGSQTFYPREGWLAMWAAIGLMLRVHLTRSEWVAARQPQRIAAGRRTAAFHPPAGRAPLRPRMPARARPHAAASTTPPPDGLLDLPVEAPQSGAVNTQPIPGTSMQWRPGHPADGATHAARSAAAAPPAAARSVTWRGRVH